MKNKAFELSQSEASIQGRKRQRAGSHRVGELVGDELPHQRDGRRPLLADLKRQNMLTECVCECISIIVRTNSESKLVL